MAIAKTFAESPARLQNRLLDARRATDALFDLLRGGALYDRPIPERHRLVFYLGHLEAFDWNLLGPALELQGFRPAWDKLFAFGIDPVDGSLPTDQPKDWPREREVRAYNTKLRQLLDRALEARRSWLVPLLADGTLLHVAIEHRLMHAETLAYLLHQLPFERKVGPPETAAMASPPFVPRTVEIPEGQATLGLARNPRGVFGWDNEFEEHQVQVPSFRMGAFPVTNGQFLEFVSSRGYQEKSFWHPADWEWKTECAIVHPPFWVGNGAGWGYRGMFQQIPLPLDWPVYVSHAEARAYARWAKQALPTEAQWHRAAYGTPHGGEREFPWGDAPPSAEHGNFDFRRWDPVPVTAHPGGRSAFGVHDLVGNGWEWTATPFQGFPGFAPFPFYPGYSANFFDGKHFVIKGGSPRTAACMLRRSFRNWFQGHYPYVYAKFRTVDG